MAIGNAICRLSTFCGNTVHPVNIINDRGIHICQSMLAYQKWGKNKKPEKKGDHFVGDYYVMFAKAVLEHPELKDEAQQLLQAWEDKDKDTHKLWKEMTNWVLKGFAETYKRFGITFEKEYFESQHYEQGRDVALEGLKKGIFIKNDDKSIIAKLESYGISDKIVLRADGTSIYITQDLFLAQQRYADYKFDQMIYVVASEQQLHFKQLFKILELLEKPFAKSLHHLSYGLVNLPSGRMKSREGTVVDADDLMDEVVMLARNEVTLRYPNMEEKEKMKRAEFIALGAIKFFLLRTDPIRDMVFNPEESISFEGETGPYIQYTHARACAILRKALQSAGSGNKFSTKNIRYELLKEDVERIIIKYFIQFPAAVEESSIHFKPHILCRLLLDLAQSFNEFYHAHTVINENVELMNARLALVDGVRQVLENGLNLLGIEAPQEM
jgi:arginyl-tRNA synthetase